MKTVKMMSQDEGKTVLRVLVTPFGTPERKDLHGEFFTPNTDFGDGIVAEKLAFYEHGFNDSVNPVMKARPEKQLIGKAAFAEQDEWGRWFDFEISRTLEYHDYLMKLVEMGLMGASSQVYPNMKSVTDTGEITRWIESEVSLTPTPASPDTISQVYALAKNYGLPMAEAVVEEEAPAPTEEIQKEFAEQLDELLAELEPAVAEELVEAVAEVPEVAADSADIEELKAEIAEIKSILTQLAQWAPQVQKIETLQKNLQDVQNGVLTLAASVRKTSAQPQSRVEQAVEAAATNRKYRSVIPDHAPGRS